MIAWSFIKPGELAGVQIAEPVPQTGQVILQIRRIGVCGTDLHAFEGSQPYFTYPRIFGHELAGVVVDGPMKDELVTFTPYFYCGHCIACRQRKFNCCAQLKVCGVHMDGGATKYFSVSTNLVIRGQGLTADELAMVEPLSIGAHAVRRAAIQPEEYVLVMGAGPIGLGTMASALLAESRVIAMDVADDRLRFAREKIKVPFTVNAKANAAEAIRELTNGDWPTVVIDATGNAAAIHNGFSYMAHGGRYVLVGLQKGDISFSHPEFHKRESTLMTSRNALREDFETVIGAIRNKRINALDFITHRTPFREVGACFASWLDPASGVIKAMIEND